MKSLDEPPWDNRSRDIGNLPTEWHHGCDRRCLALTRTRRGGRRSQRFAVDTRPPKTDGALAPAAADAVSRRPSEQALYMGPRGWRPRDARRNRRGGTEKRGERERENESNAIVSRFSACDRKAAVSLIQETRRSRTAVKLRDFALSGNETVPRRFTRQSAAIRAAECLLLRGTAARSASVPKRLAGDRRAAMKRSHRSAIIDGR